MDRARRRHWSFAAVAAIAAALAAVLAAPSNALAVTGPGERIAVQGLVARAKPAPPVICTAQQDFDAVHGVGSPPVDQVVGCLEDFSFNDGLYAGDQASQYVPITSLTAKPSTATVVFNASMTITLDLGYPTCTQAQLSNGPSPTPCSYDPEILSARWIPQSQAGYQYPTGATFNACGQNSQGQLPTGVDSITCTGSFSAPASEVAHLDPNAWFVIRARDHVDSSDATINGEEFTEDAVSVKLSATTPALPGPVSVGFTGKSSALSATDRAALSALAAKLSAGAAVTVTGYAKGSATLARKRAAAAAAFLKSKLSLSVTIKSVTSSSSNKATVVTTRR